MSTTEIMGNLDQGIVILEPDHHPPETDSSAQTLVIHIAY